MSIAVAAGFLALAAAATSPCESPANPVVRENCLPGSPSSEWDVNGAGSPDVVAFSTRASVEPCTSPAAVRPTGPNASPASPPIVICFTCARVRRRRATQAG